jgi:hypothetical protein
MIFITVDFNYNANDCTESNKKHMEITSIDNCRAINGLCRLPHRHLPKDIRNRHNF